ncbi:hypothetical protein EZS27_013545, partial [termite gut metagenome]
MKRVVLLFIVGILFIGKSLGQDHGRYYIRLEGKVTNSKGRTACTAGQEISLINESLHQRILMDNTKLNHDESITYPNRMPLIPPKFPFSHIYFYGWRGEYDREGECVEMEKKGSYINIESKYPYIPYMKITHGETFDG